MSACRYRTFNPRSADLGLKVRYLHADIDTLERSARFFKVTDSSDARAFSVGYYRVFKEELLKLSRDLMLGTMMNWTTIDGQPAARQ